MGTAGRVYVVLVNWNTWRHTVECIESLLRSDHPDFQIVVCDNASSDDSLAHLAAWASGREPFVPPPASPVPLDPPAGKPVRFVPLSRAEAERGGLAACADADVVLVDTGANLGFAGGCNVGMRYALARGDADFVWLLNNDTVVEPAAMRALVERLRERPDAGQCGSTLYFYHDPTRVQALGGTGFDRSTAQGFVLPWTDPPTDEATIREIEAATGYVEGASIMVTRRFLDEVGLMSEAYFLYYEEMDWMVRARGRFTVAYAPRSVVFHKEGASAGTNRDVKRRSSTADRYLLRSRLRFVWRCSREDLPDVWRDTLRIIRERARERQWDRVLTSLLTVLSPRTYFGHGR